MQRTQRDAFLEQCRTLSRLRLLADELTIALRVLDTYTVLKVSQENVRQRARLQELAGEVHDFAPIDPIDVRLAIAAQQDSTHISEVDKRFRDWRFSERTGDIYAASWCAQTLENVPYIIDKPTIGGLRGRFAKVPAIVVAAGPSLDKNIHLLRHAKGRAVIIAMNQTIGATARADAPADIVVTADSANLLYHFTESGAETLPAIVLRPSINSGILRLPASRFFVHSGGIPHENWICNLLSGDRSNLMGGGSVAHFCYSLAEFLGCDPVIMIGQDLAFSTNSMYARTAADHDHAFEVSEDGTRLQHRTSERKTKHIPHTANLIEPIVEVPGYYGGVVKTTVSLSIFHRVFCQWFEAAQGERTVINSTEGGARIEGSLQMPFADAIAAYCHSPVDVEAVLAEASTVDVEARLTRVFEALVVLDEQMETAHRIAVRCIRNTKEVAERGWTPADEQRLVAEDKRFVRALEPLDELFGLMLAQDTRDVTAAIAEMQDIQRSVDLALTIYTGAKRSIETIRPHLQKAIEKLSRPL